VAGAVLLLALAAATAAQQQTFTLGPRTDTPAARRLVFETDATAAARRPGGYGWVSVEVSNPDTTAHEAELTVRDPMQLGAPLAVGRIRLGAGERSRVVLPLPYTGWMGELTVEVDGGPVSSTRLDNVPAGNTQTLPSLLALTDDAALGSLLRSAVEARLPTLVKSGALAGFVVKRVRDLPDRWQMLSGFDAVVLDLRSVGLSEERQQVLADYVAAGGHLVAAGSPGTTAGPLAGMFEASTPADTSAAAIGSGSRGRHGFGWWIVTLPDGSAFGSDVIQWLGGSQIAGFQRTFSGLPQDGLGSHLEIPGLGKVPKSAFLLLIVLFVTAIAILTFREVRRRRHGRLLIIVPGTGLLFTGALLAYGTFSEGLGIKGVVRSLTLLDQRSHQAVAVAQRTLYAGMSPSAIPLDAGTLLVSWDQYRGEDDDRVHRMRLDTSAGWVAGGEALPSRWPTHLATVTVGRPRERLRLRRDGPERLEVIPDAGLRAARGDRTLLVRDFDGEWWVGPGAGPLRRTLPSEVRPCLAESVAGFSGLTTAAGPGWSEHRSFMLAGSVHSVNVDTRPPHGLDVQAELDSWISELLDGVTLRGSYVLRVASDPCVDDLGLDVDWLEREQIVVGRLAREDLLE
jgi:hypothetical protein